MQLKTVMALTGAVLLLYLAVHMIGNVKSFFGEEALDTYAHWLRVVGEPALPREGVLWIVRTVLLVSVAHIVAATIPLDVIATLNRDYRLATIGGRRRHIA